MNNVELLLTSDDFIRLLLSLLIGGMIGVERELRDKAAGFRTMMFICAGSTLFTIFSLRLATLPGLPFSGDPVRIAAQIVSGVGFLGAGVILREHGEIRGLTTASTVWAVAALGMGVGAGLYLFSILAALMLLLVLWLFPAAERLMVRLTQLRSYMVVCQARFDKSHDLEERVRHHHLRVLMRKYIRRGEEMICTLTVSGKQKNHEALVKDLFNDPDVIEFDY